MSKEIRQMIDKVKNFKEFLNENTNNILNKSFNLTTTDVNELLDGLRDEYITKGGVASITHKN